MKFYIAVYDPAHALVGGEYWMYQAASLSRRLLDTFYYDIAATHLPDDPNRLSADDLHGGYTGLNDQWVCWYRFINGGRDQAGRPGRFLILAAFADRQKLVGYDGTGMLECDLFRELALLAPKRCPLPALLSFEIEWSIPRIEAVATTVQVPDKLPVEFSGPAALCELVRVCGDLPTECRFDCTVTRYQGAVKGRLLKTSVPPQKSALTAPSDSKSPHISRSSELAGSVEKRRSISQSSKSAASTQRLRKYSKIRIPDAMHRGLKTYPLLIRLLGTRWLFFAIGFTGIVFATIMYPWWPRQQGQIDQPDQVSDRSPLISNRPDTQHYESLLNEVSSTQPRALPSLKTKPRLSPRGH